MSLNIVRPDVPRTRGERVPERLRNVTVTEDQYATLELAILDHTANPVDLTVYDLGNAGSSISNSEDTIPHADSIRLLVREYVGRGYTYAEGTATVQDAVNGVVQVAVPTAVAANPGVYWAALQIMNASDQILFENSFLISVVPGVTKKKRRRHGMPTIPEIRLHLRDSAPEENYLLDAVTFSDAEIAACLGRCVDYWNDIMPPLRRKYTTETFPYRYQWMEGTIASLFKMAAEFYQKNDLQVSAGGIAVGDTAKAQWYLQQGQLRWAEFERWAKSAKISENIRGGFGGLHSTYSAR